MKEEKESYSLSEVKQIYAELINQIGHDAGACCNWNGYDTLTLDEWKTAWWQEFQSYTTYERENAIHYERARLAAELLKLNNHTPNYENE